MSPCHTPRSLPALDPYRDAEGAVGDGGGIKLGAAIGGFNHDTMALQEGFRLLALDRKVDVLGNGARCLGELHGVERADRDAYDVGARVEEWTTAVAWLDRRRHLHAAAIVARSGKRADDAGADDRIRGEQTRKRKAYHDHTFAG